jgi:surface antigen
MGWVHIDFSIDVILCEFFGSIMKTVIKASLAAACSIVCATAAGAGVFVWGHCTWGVASIKGDPVKNSKGVVIDYSLPWSGNAREWCVNAKKYATVDGKQSIGAIIIFNGPSAAYGHAGIVTGAGVMKSMNDLPAGNAVGRWTFDRKISGFPNSKTPLAPACYIHYRENKI